MLYVPTLADSKTNDYFKNIMYMKPIMFTRSEDSGVKIVISSTEVSCHAGSYIWG